MDDLKHYLEIPDGGDGDDSKAKKTPYEAILMRDAVMALVGGGEDRAETESQLAVVRGRLAEAEATGRAVAAARDEERESRRRAEDRASRVETLLRESTATSADLEKEVQNLQDRLAESVAALTEKTRSGGTSCSESELSDSAKLELEVTLRRCQAELQEANERCDAAEARASEAARASIALREEVGALGAQLQSSRCESTAANVELESVRAALEAQRTVASDKSADAASTASLRTEVAGLQAALQRAEAKTRVVQDNLDASAACVGALNGELSATVTKAAEAKAAAEQDARKMKDRAAALKTDKKKLEAMTKELHSELKFALETGESLHKELDATRADLESARVAEAGTRIRTEEAEVCMARAEGLLKGLREELEEAKRGATEARAAQHQWEEQFAEERRLRQKLGRKITDLQGNIRVICRIRPLNEREDESCVEVLDSERLLLDGSPHNFDFIFGASSAQDQVFLEVQPTVMSALEGFNVSIFAYGQTGSGKTFTMEGTPSNRGVNHRALSELFAYASSSADTNYTFTVSMLEVYNEAIKDLLGSGGDAASDLEIRVGKGSRGGPSVYVEGLVECEVSALEEVERLMREGGRSRHVGSNNVNEHSSRSHLVVSVSVVATRRDTGLTAHGKLNLIDLAGSERLKVTAAEGVRLKEAQNINRSLSALGDVVAALGKRSPHVPYRNSKLTFLLQDSLSANSRVLMFVNVTPALSCGGESTCSLNFAGRCRAVQLGAAKKTIKMAKPSGSRADGRDGE